MWPCSPTRRALLATAAGLAASGCSALDGEPRGNRPVVAEHPATTGLAEVPRLGPEATSAETVVVEFGDPSCPQCARFAERTFPELRSQYVDAGHMTYVWRGLPTVEPWARRAVSVLLATHARDPATFWWLKYMYHEGHTVVTAGDVVERAVDWLAERDDVDGRAVRDDVADGTFADRIETDERVAAASDVETVPSFVLFREGEYVTTVFGPQSPAVFANALSL